MNTKAVALTIVFTALALALTPIAVPAVFLRATFYRFWEIPAVMALFLVSPLSGVAVALLRVLGEMTLFPGPLGVIGPLSTVLPTLGMLFGVYLAGRLLNRRGLKEGKWGKPLLFFTAFGSLMRMAVAPVVMYPIYRFVGNLPDVTIMGIMPLLEVFALTLCIYTISSAYIIARLVHRTLGVGTTLTGAGTETERAKS